MDDLLFQELSEDKKELAAQLSVIIAESAELAMRQDELKKKGNEILKEMGLEEWL